MRTPTVVLQIVVLTSAVALFSADAGAGDCHCDSGYRTARGHTQLIRSGSGTCSVRNPYHPSTRYVIPRYNRGARHYDSGCGSRAHGAPWSELRRYLPTGRDEIRRLHVRRYFLKRYPFAVAPAILETTTLDEAADVDTLLAIGTDAVEHPRKLDRAGHLDRGMGRFFVRDYDGARADFDAVLKLAPKEQRARWGLLLVAVCKNEWKTASQQLGTLAEAGELRRGDRLELEGSFADPSVVPNIVKGLREYAGYATGDSDAHLVTAWALAYQGDVKRARVYARMARRGKAGHPALKALERNLAPAPKAEARPATNPARAPETKPIEVKDVERAPKAGLHRELASAR